MNSPSKLSIYLDRALQASLLLLALSAPISIAATQTAWALAILFWIIRAIVVRPAFQKTAMDIAILVFVGLTVISSTFSYEPEVSLRKLVAVSLVTIVYLVAGGIQSRSLARGIAAVLLIGGSAAALYSIGTFAVGRNLKVVRLTTESPLRTAGVQENDTIVNYNGKSVSSPDQLADATRTVDGVAKVRVYRYENYLNYDLSAASVPENGEPAERLGIAEWSRGRDVRAAGFYGHYTTYAESVQLMLSVCLGLLICLPGGFFARNRILLAAAVGMFGIALFLTVTRASWAGFAISAAVMVFIGTSRKTTLICIALAVPIAIAGLLYVQQKRNVAFIDSTDASTTWRTTVWREGVGLLISNPRHLALGVGMDSVKTHYLEWGLFDNGKLPIGHMHSTPLQIALERGVPALIAWIVWILIYLKLLWKGLQRTDIEWPERGVILGGFGGTIGFLSSGLVHYNWGDSEVVMIFYLLMGLSLAMLRFPLIEPLDLSPDQEI